MTNNIIITKLKFCYFIRTNCFEKKKKQQMFKDFLSLSGFALLDNTNLRIISLLCIIILLYSYRRFLRNLKKRIKGAKI